MFFNDLEAEFIACVDTDYPLSEDYNLEIHPGVTEAILFRDYVTAVFNWHITGIIDADVCEDRVNFVDCNSNKYGEMLDRIRVNGISTELLELYKGKTKHFHEFLSAYGLG